MPPKTVWPKLPATPSAVPQDDSRGARCCSSRPMARTATRNGNWLTRKATAETGATEDPAMVASWSAEPESTDLLRIDGASDPKGCS